MVDQIVLLPEGTRYQLLAPVVRGKKGTHTKLLSGLAAEGFARVRINGEVRELAAVSYTHLTLPTNREV